MPNYACNIVTHYAPVVVVLVLVLVDVVLDVVEVVEVVVLDDEVEELLEVVVMVLPNLSCPFIFSTPPILLKLALTAKST